MIGLGSLRCLLTLMLVTSSGFHLARCLPMPGRQRGAHGACGSRVVVEMLHLLMGVSMIAMIWPRAAPIPVLCWVPVFAGAGIWFTIRSLRPGSRDAASVYSASMSAAMVWMGLTELLDGPTALGGPTATTGHQTHDMAVSGPGVASATWVSGALGAYLVAAACWWWARGMRVTTLGGWGTTTARESIQWIAVCHGLMSAAMGLALLAAA